MIQGKCKAKNSFLTSSPPRPITTQTPRLPRLYTHRHPAVLARLVHQRRPVVRVPVGLVAVVRDLARGVRPRSRLRVRLVKDVLAFVVPKRPQNDVAHAHNVVAVRRTVAVQHQHAGRVARGARVGPARRHFHTRDAGQEAVVKRPLCLRPLALQHGWVLPKQKPLADVARFGLGGGEGLGVEGRPVGGVEDGGCGCGGERFGRGCGGEGFGEDALHCGVQEAEGRMCTVT